MPSIMLRRVVDEDCTMFYRWWRDPEVQRFVGNPRSRLDWETHVAWFIETITSEWWFVGCRSAARPLESRRVPVGAVRVDRVGDCDWISIVLDPRERGRGYGTEMIEAVSAMYPRTLYARIHRLNAPSLRAFEKAGYVPDHEQGAHWMVRRRDR